MTGSDMASRGTVAGLVLAAGEGKRFGGPKAPYVYDGERLVDRSVRILRAGGCDPIFVILGAWIGEVPGAEVVVNDKWATGMGSSLRAGLSACTSHPEVSSALVTLVDLPGLTGQAIAALIDGADRQSLAAAEFDGRRANPVVLGRDHWAGVADAAVGDQGARAYLADRDVRLVPCDGLADGRDLDLRPADGSEQP
jgi:CTP:molybdopterin cytidylyltransferase MocA